jgi:peptidoglycan/xylan/chitin deacetylase (PgdA/CDA1 family)
VKKTIYRTLANIASPGNQNGKVQIFIFHRVLDRPDPLAPGEPDIARFDEIIRRVSDTFNVISLAEAVERLRSKSLPKRAACITFDDGYRDNYTNALPILKKYGVPFTVFIATDFLDGRMMWNDQVIEAVRVQNQPLTLPELGVIDGVCASHEQKRQLLRAIIPKIKYMPSPQREELSASIAQRCGCQHMSLMMSRDDVIALRDQGVDIGAHTRTHPILANLTQQDARREIAESREYLEALLKQRVGLFAYPNGRPGQDYLQRDRELVKELGFNAAVSTPQAVATCGDDIFALPRFTPWDQNIDKFMFRSMIEAYKQKAKTV